MPYIPPKEREVFDVHINAIVASIEHMGQLNYVISKIFHKMMPEILKYAAINDIMGAILCIKKEMRYKYPNGDAKTAVEFFIDNIERIEEKLYNEVAR